MASNIWTKEFDLPPKFKTTIISVHRFAFKLCDITLYNYKSPKSVRGEPLQLGGSIEQVSPDAFENIKDNPESVTKDLSNGQYKTYMVWGEPLESKSLSYGDSLEILDMCSKILKDLEDVRNTLFRIVPGIDKSSHKAVEYFRTDKYEKLGASIDSSKSPNSTVITNYDTSSHDYIKKVAEETIGMHAADIRLLKNDMFPFLGDICSIMGVMIVILSCPFIKHPFNKDEILAKLVRKVSVKRDDNDQVISFRLSIIDNYANMFFCDQGIFYRPDTIIYKGQGRSTNENRLFLDSELRVRDIDAHERSQLMKHPKR